jgi:hypothetical protein
MFKTLVLKIIVLRPNKKNSWLASHSHKGEGIFLKIFTHFKNFLIVFFGRMGAFFLQYR